MLLLDHGFKLWGQSYQGFLEVGFKLTELGRNLSKEYIYIYIYIYKINKLKKKRKKLMRCSGTELLRVNLIEDMFE